jgi:hypothetical protein
VAGAVATNNRARVPEDDLERDEIGIRFQPFFLQAAVDAADMRGKGLFARCLHYRGTITPNSMRLSCICDDCGESFLVRSFHTGWGGEEYFYSDTGRFTLIASVRVGEKRIA